MGSIVSLAERTNRPAFVGSPEEENGGIRERILPDRYQKMPILLGEPPYSETYQYISSGAKCYVAARSVPESSALPLDDPLEVIRELREVLEDCQGLIEVKTGRTQNGYPYVYVITKELKGPRSVDYRLTLYLNFSNGVVLVHGVFNEKGKIGRREKAVRLRTFGRVKSGSNLKALGPWEADPYDPRIREGFLMNVSENEVYDEEFPEHPLSEMRSMIREMIRMN